MKPGRHHIVVKTMQELLEDYGRLEELVATVARAWSNQDWEDRRQLGLRMPELADALISIEADRIDHDDESV